MDDNAQNVPEKIEPKKPGIRTMISDVQEYARSKKFSLGELVARRGSTAQNSGTGSDFERLRLWIYISAAVLILVLGGFVAFWIKQKLQAPPEISGIEAPKPIIPAGREQTIKLASPDRKIFFDEWEKLFTLQLLPREFLYVKIFDENRPAFLQGRGFFEFIAIAPPPIFLDSLDERMTIGLMDTSRGNEPVLIFEIDSYSSGFAGLLQL